MIFAMIHKCCFATAKVLIRDRKASFAEAIHYQATAKWLFIIEAPGSFGSPPTKREKKMKLITFIIEGIGFALFMAAVCGSMIVLDAITN